VHAFCSARFLLASSPTLSKFTRQNNLCREKTTCIFKSQNCRYPHQAQEFPIFLLQSRSSVNASMLLPDTVSTVRRGPCPPLFSGYKDSLKVPEHLGCSSSPDKNMLISTLQSAIFAPDVLASFPMVPSSLPPAVLAD